MSATLYELTGDWLRLMELADDPETDDQIFADTLEGLEGEIEDKADAYAAVIRNLEVTVGGLEGQIAAIKKEAERVKAHKESIENRIAKMKETLCTAMLTVNKPKFKTQKFSFWVKKTPAAVVIDNQAEMPFDLFRVPEPEPDKTKIKKVLEDAKKEKEKLEEQLKGLAEDSKEAVEINKKIAEINNSTAYAHLESHDIMQFR